MVKFKKLINLKTYKAKIVNKKIIKISFSKICSLNKISKMNIRKLKTLLNKLIKSHKTKSIFKNLGKNF